MYRFLLSRRWIGFAIFVIALSGLCVRLGFWQLHRLEHRLANNKIINKHLSGKPVPLEQYVTPTTKVDQPREWKRVTATGTYDVGHQVTVKFMTRGGQPGVDVVTPLVLASGDAILVDRGWMATQNTVARPKNVPAPPSGTVTITGWIRQNNGAGNDAVKPADGQVRGVASNGMASYVPYHLYRGYLNLRSSSPEPATKLRREPRPSEGQGPHLFYAIQWWFFAGLAIFGWFYFARVEARERRAGTHHSQTGSTKDPVRPPTQVTTS